MNDPFAGTVLLVREVRAHPDRSNKDSYVLSHWIQEEGAELREVSQEGYTAWLQQALQWLGWILCEHEAEPSNSNLLQPLD